MITCENCGHQLADTALFCSNCGAKIPTPSSESEPYSAPISESNPVYEQTPSPVSAPLPEPNTLPSDRKLCPICDNECYIEAPVCPYCGKEFPAPVVNDNGNNGNNDEPSSKTGKIVSVIAIVLCALSVFTTASNIISYRNFTLISLLSLAASIVVLVGLIKRKNNKLPAIGYGISAVNNLLSIFIFRGSLSIALILSVVQLILTAALYLGNEKIRKIWYAPIAISVLATFVSAIPALNGVGEIIVAITTAIGSALGVLVTCLNAKYNWHAPENNSENNSENTTQY